MAARTDFAKTVTLTPRMPGATITVTLWGPPRRPRRQGRQRGHRIGNRGAVITDVSIGTPDGTCRKTSQRDSMTLAAGPADRRGQPRPADGRHFQRRRRRGHLLREDDHPQPGLGTIVFGLYAVRAATPERCCRRVSSCGSYYGNTSTSWRSAGLSPYRARHLTSRPRPARGGQVTGDLGCTRPTTGQRRVDVLPVTSSWDPAFLTWASQPQSAPS